MAEAKNLPAKSILEGRVKLFMRPNSPYWWTGFHHRGKFVRSSTKQTHESAAEAIARNWYFEKQGELSRGELSTSSKTFKQAADALLTDYRSLVARGERSVKTLRTLEINLNCRLLPYFSSKKLDVIDTQDWFEFKNWILRKFNPQLKRGTFHHYKNVLRLVLKAAMQRGWLKSIPSFKETYTERRIDSPRPWFSINEYKSLLAAIKRHIETLQDRQPRWIEGAEELYDYVVFMTNTGLRVGESANVRFCDIEIIKNTEAKKDVLIIRNIKGKRGTGTARSFYGAVDAYKRVCARRDIQAPKSSTENVFPTIRREMFKEILKKSNLRFSKGNPPAKRDFVSLRATYICFRLLDGAPVYDVANNCRTSVAMIENSYARYLGGENLESINNTREKPVAIEKMMAMMEHMIEKSNSQIARKPRELTPQMTQALQMRVRKGLRVEYDT